MTAVQTSSDATAKPLMRPGIALSLVLPSTNLRIGTDNTMPTAISASFA